MLSFLIALGILAGAQAFLFALPATNPLCRAAQNTWNRFWILFQVGTTVGGIIALIAIPALLIGAATGHIWVMLISFVILEFVALGLRFGMTIFGLGAQWPKIIEFALVALLTWAIINFVLRIAGPVLGTPLMMSFFVLSVLIWVISAVMNRRDPRRYARACANVMVMWWIITIPITILQRDAWFQAYKASRWDAPREAGAEENLLTAAITRQIMQVNQAKRDRVQNHKKSMFVYIDLRDSTQVTLKVAAGAPAEDARLFGYNDQAQAKTSDELLHQELVFWIVDQTVPSAIQASFGGTVGSVYILKADANGQFLAASSVGMWIPLLKGIGGASYLSEKKPPLVSPTTDPVTKGRMGSVPKVTMTFLNPSNLSAPGQKGTLIPADGQWHALSVKWWEGSEKWILVEFADGEDAQQFEYQLALPNGLGPGNWTGTLSNYFKCVSNVSGSAEVWGRVKRK